MITEINSNGKLIVQAENELESYALQKWAADNNLPSGLVIKWGIGKVIQQVAPVEPPAN